MTLVPMRETEILSYCIANLIKCYLQLGDNKGALVLMQYRWPLFEHQFRKMSPKEFKFSADFIRYIVTVDILEEFMFLLNEGNELYILPEVITEPIEADPSNEAKKQGEKEQRLEEQKKALLKHIFDSPSNTHEMAMSVIHILQSFLKGEVKRLTS